MKMENIVPGKEKLLPRGRERRSLPGKPHYFTLRPFLKRGCDRGGKTLAPNAP